MTETWLTETTTTNTKQRLNEETREALDEQSVDMDRIRHDIRGLQDWEKMICMGM